MMKLFVPLWYLGNMRDGCNSEKKNNLMKNVASAHWIYFQFLVASVRMSVLTASILNRIVYVSFFSNKSMRESF